jgi:hypothetical protein
VTVTSKTFSQGVLEHAAWEDDLLVVSSAAILSNNGFYPIQVSTFLNATIPQVGSLGNVSSNVISVLPGQVKNLNFSLTLDPLASAAGLSAAAVDRIFYNGSDVVLALGLKAALVPFAGLRIIRNETVHVAPFVGGLDVTATNRTAGQIVLAVSFQNQETSSFPYQMYISLGGSLQSSVVSGVAVSGQRTNVQLVVGGSAGVTSGPHPATIHTVVLGRDFAIPLTVEVPS